jgi:hypothetical protein
MPAPGMASAACCFFGSSATIASVVMSRPATDAAPCSATRTTLCGVDDALGHEVAVFAVLGVEAIIVLLLVEDLPDDDGAVRN